MPGYGGGVGGDNAPGNEAGAGGFGGNGNGGEGGVQGGRGRNPGRGYAGTAEQPGGRGRDPGWDKPGGYDYGPDGDVVVKVDSMTQQRSFKLYGQAFDDWQDAKFEQAGIPGLIGKALYKGTTMGRIAGFLGRTFGVDVDEQGSYIGVAAERGEGGAEGVTDPPKEEEPEPDENGEAKPEGPATDDLAGETYRDLLAHIRGERGNTDWETPDWGWIYELSGLEPPQRTT